MAQKPMPSRNAGVNTNTMTYQMCIRDSAKSAVSVLDEENGMMEEEPAYQMNLKNGSIRVYIGEDGKQYAQQGDYEAQQSGNLSITCLLYTSRCV